MAGRAGTRAEAGRDRATVVARRADPELWWPRGLRRAAAATTLDGRARSTAGGDALAPDADRLPHRAPRHHARRRRHAVRARRQRRAGASSAASTGSPTTASRHRVDPDAATRDRLAQAVDAERQPAAGLGRRDLREPTTSTTRATSSGLLVWQDFLFACAAYPEEEPLRSRGRGRGARQRRPADAAPEPGAVERQQREHLGLRATGAGSERLDGRTVGRSATTSTLLPRHRRRARPDPAVLAGQPVLGLDGPSTPTTPTHGTHAHLGRVERGRLRRLPRLPARGSSPSSAGRPARRGRRCAARVSDEPLTPDSPGMLHHQKADDGNGKLDRGLAAALRRRRDDHRRLALRDASSTRRGRSRVGVEHFRSLRPRCTGTIVWQLNDCWPVTSWAAIDGDGRRKPLWYALRAAYAAAAAHRRSRRRRTGPRAASRSTTRVETVDRALSPCAG